MRHDSLRLPRVGGLLVVIATAGGWPAELARAVDVSGSVLWTDSAGGTHPSRGVRIELFLMHTDGRPHEHMGTGATGTGGTYSFAGLPALGSGDQWQAFALSEHDGARVNYTGTGTSVYALHSAGVTTAAIPPMVADNVSTDGRAFGVLDALYSGWYYGTHMTAGVPMRAVQFPDTVTGFDPVSKIIHVGDSTWSRWDAITHEYGHSLSDLSDTDDQPAIPTHAFGDTSIPDLGKDAGSRLAWGEGLATFHGLAAQRYNIATQNTPLSAPEVGDTFYGFSTGSESIEDRYAGSVARGEGDELAVARILWDLMDSGDSEAGDEVGKGEASLYSEIDSIATIERLGGLWDHLASTTPDAALADVGRIFEDNSVSPEPWGSPMDMTITTADSRPEFKWNAGNDGANDSFSILFFDQAFSTRIGAPLAAGSALSYRPSGAEWAVLTAWVMAHGDTTFNWVITGADTVGPMGAYAGADITGPYWSGARSFTMTAPVPGPGTLVLAVAWLAGAPRRRGRDGSGPRPC